MSSKINEIPFNMLRQLIQEHTALWKKNLPEITKQQYAVLVALSDYPNTEQKDLIKLSLSTKATLAEMLSRMEEKKLITRIKSSSDRRRVFVNLTSSGEELLAKTKPLANNVDEYFLSRIIDSEKSNFDKIVKKLLGR